MSKISLVIRREFNERVRKRSFLVATILTPLLMIALMGGAVAFFALYKGETKSIEVIDRSGLIAGQLENSREIEYVPTERTLDQINALHPNTWGALVIDSNVVADPAGVRLYTYSSSTVIIESEISEDIAEIIEAEKLKSYDIENLPQILREVKTEVTLNVSTIDEDGEEESSSSTLAIALAYIFGFMMYGIVFAYGAQVMQGVIEEKNSKVLEVVVSSVRPFQLMMGKIIGIACVALTQFVIWGILLAVGGAAVMHFLVPDDIVAAAQSMQEMQAVGGAAMGGEMADTLAGGLPPEVMGAIGGLMNFGYIAKLLGSFVVYFLGGYLLYAAMFAAVGSAVDNVQDSQQFQLPITLPIILGFFGMMQAMQDPESPIAFWMSIIPFTSPLVMMARIPYGVPTWELALSIGLLVLTFVVMVWLAGKIYRVGIFMTGKKPTVKELLKWITYKS